MSIPWTKEQVDALIRFHREHGRRDSPGTFPGQTVEGEASKGNPPAPSTGEQRNGEPGPGRGVNEDPARVSDAEVRRG